jgi:hypothetical protein
MARRTLTTTELHTLAHMIQVAGDAFRKDARAIRAEAERLDITGAEGAAYSRLAQRFDEHADEADDWCGCLEADEIVVTIDSDDD